MLDNNLQSEKPFDLNQGKKAWVVAVDMGYGHQRTAYPLRDIALGRLVINANNYLGIPRRDKKIWTTSKSLYEFISRFRAQVSYHFLYLQSSSIMHIFFSLSKL